MKDPNSKFQEFINKPTDESDPYWNLFKVKDQMNDTIIEAVKYGFLQGFKEGIKIGRDLNTVVETSKENVIPETPKQTRTFIDPPSGWKYGFPKEIKPGQDTRELLLNSGYPQNDVDWALQNCRTWEEGVQE